MAEVYLIQLLHRAFLCRLATFLMSIVYIILSIWLLCIKFITHCGHSQGPGSYHGALGKERVEKGGEGEKKGKGEKKRKGKKEGKEGRK